VMELLGSEDDSSDGLFRRSSGCGGAVARRPAGSASAFNHCHDTSNRGCAAAAEASSACHGAAANADADGDAVVVVTDDDDDDEGAVEEIKEVGEAAAYLSDHPSEITGASASGARGSAGASASAAVAPQGRASLSASPRSTGAAGSPSSNGDGPTAARAHSRAHAPASMGGSAAGSAGGSVTGATSAASGSSAGFSRRRKSGSSTRLEDWFSLSQQKVPRPPPSSQVASAAATSAPGAASAGEYRVAGDAEGGGSARSSKPAAAQWASLLQPQRQTKAATNATGVRAMPHSTDGTGARLSTESGVSPAAKSSGPVMVIGGHYSAGVARATGGSAVVVPAPTSDATLSLQASEAPIAPAAATAGPAASAAASPVFDDTAQPLNGAACGSDSVGAPHPPASACASGGSLSPDGAHLAAQPTARSDAPLPHHEAQAVSSRATWIVAAGLSDALEAPPHAARTRGASTA
jgi:hypothetical protein